MFSCIFLFSHISYNGVRNRKVISTFQYKIDILHGHYDLKDGLQIHKFYVFHFHPQ